MEGREPQIPRGTEDKDMEDEPWKKKGSTGVEGGNPVRVDGESKLGSTRWCTFWKLPF